MNLPTILQGDSLTRLLQGAAVGAVATMILGFGWGGWTLGSTAATQAEESAANAVVATLTPVCVSNFQNSADAADNLAALKAQSSYKRTGFVEKGGWATFPGNDKANRDVAKACAVLLSKMDKMEPTPS